MNFKKIIEDYNKINTQCSDCKKSQREAGQKLILETTNALKDRSLEEYSKYFSELFNMWVKTTETEIDINITPFNEETLDKRYKEYTPTSSNSVQQKLKKQKVQSSVSKIIEEDYQGKKMIEYLLSQLWLYIFNEDLVFLNSENSSTKSNQKYFHKNWALYELLNQISKMIHKMVQDGNSQKIKISSLKENEKNNILENTEAICKYILESYILGVKQTDKNNKSWFPELQTNQNIQLSYILATSDLISYIFEYKLMDIKNKKRYLHDINTNIKNIYNKLTESNFLDNSIEIYMDKNDKEDIVVKYKNHQLCPRIVFIFTISIIQEVVKKALTQSRNNIFFSSNKGHRDNGLSEKRIMTQIKKDVKSYKLIYYYFDKPHSTTIKSKEKKLNEWITELNKLRYGIVDDYLFDLAKVAQITFRETTVTSIETPKKIK